MFIGFFLLSIFNLSLQVCPEETSRSGIKITWHETSEAINIHSDPLCYFKDIILTRNCSNSTWTPSLGDLKPCLTIIQDFDLSSCPPGFHSISDSNNKFCYEVSAPKKWKDPCFKSGGATVITELDTIEIESLLKKLMKTHSSKFYWLPARRVKVFNPLLWYTPGPNWGHPVEDNNTIRMYASIMYNCLVLDVEKKIIFTQPCWNEYPNLCLYKNELTRPSICPKGYHAFRFLPDKGTCFGIEYSDSIFGSTFNSFLKSKCSRPMRESQKNSLPRFIFKKIAELSNLPKNDWCWFDTFYTNEVQTSKNLFKNEMIPPKLLGTINGNGTLGLRNPLTKLPCMACETEKIYGETEFMFEYDKIQEIIYLTVYIPSGLWKYNQDDIGVQCFSDAKGFVKVVNIDPKPVTEVILKLTDMTDMEKVIYAINPVTHRSAQYWCEGHTKNFSLISTNKIIVNPGGDKGHVFALVLKYPYTSDEQDILSMTSITSDLTNIFDVNTVLVMEILQYSTEEITILTHLHVTLTDTFDDDVSNIQSTYNYLKTIAELELHKHNYTFVNISSSLYCLPSTTYDYFILNWELTPIGFIAAPKEFCLQANGLPVKRHCHGSYHFGGYWGEIDGYCNKNYEPSYTTTFLYNFVKGQVSENCTSTFITDGLGFVLGNVDIIIPADIYYLSMSLQHILDVAEKNETHVEMGDIENIAWVMDRVMVLNEQYLRLAQTLNSTNVILDSINDIIEILAVGPEWEDNTMGRPEEEDNINKYQLATEPQFIVQISYPTYNNVTGLIIIKKSLSENFTDMIIQPLYMNTTLEDILTVQDLEIACWVPEEVINTLTKSNVSDDDLEVNKKDVHVIISVFQNDAVFQEINRNKHIINSRIIGISIPGYVSNLKYPVPILFKKLHDANISANFCGYWDFQSQSEGDAPGFWAKNGCYSTKSINNITICECFHLTHFGQLLAIRDPTRNENTMDEVHVRALNIITLVCCFLSLVGIVGIWVTALVFQTWRKKAGTKVLLHLSTAIALPLIFIITFNLEKSIFVKKDDKYVVAENMKLMCIALGSLLHYSILSSFMWMLITGILQFTRYVQVLGVRRPSRFMVKFTLIGWGIPIIPVLLILLVNPHNYIPNDYSNNHIKPICYPRGLSLILSIILPICIILITNIILFALVMVAISRRDGTMRSTDIDLIGAQLRLSVFLFFLLGLTWVFGLFSFSNNLMWSYLFCLTSTIEGFVLFVYFVVCDPNTRNLWITLMKPQYSVRSSRESVVSISSS